MNQDEQKIAQLTQAAQFWQMKYFELLGHSSQVIAQLGQPMMAQNLMEKLSQHVPQPPKEGQ